MMLNKRIGRELRSNLLRYSSIFLLLMMGMTVVIGLSAATDSITKTVQAHADRNNIEDGEFSVLAPLSEADIQTLSEKGAQVEESFYVNIDLSDQSTLRVFKNRKEINLLELDQGKQATAAGEIVLEKHYAKKHNYGVGDTISFGETPLTITGIGSVPDYDHLLASLADTSSDPLKFSIAFLAEEQYEMLNKSDILSSSETYMYSYKLSEQMTPKKLKDDLTNLTSFVPADDNPRIFASIDDAKINKISALAFGVIYLCMISYLISVFVINGIDNESAVIGTLYSMGYLKNELVRHFLILPILVVTAGGVAGTGLGLALVKVLSADSTSVFSYPELQIAISPYMIGYGVLVPLFIAAAVNLVFVNKKLSQQPLKLLRNMRQENKISSINLEKLNFLNRFRIREILRELRINLALFIGLSLAILIMVFGVLVYTSISNMTKDLAKDVSFNYMYFLKSPPEKVPAGGEASYTISLYGQSKYSSDDIRVAVQGISTDNPFYNFKVEEATQSNELYVSSSASIKFGWKKGDSITLDNHLDDKEYTFIVKDIVHYGYGLYTFMNLDSMREMFKQNNIFYNTVLSSDPLQIDSERLESVITLSDIKRTGENFYDQMFGMIVLIMIISILLFVIVMFFLLKIKIDKSVFNISLIKIMGYSEKEVKKLYLGTNLYIVLSSAIIATPVSKLIMDQLFPYMVSNVAIGFNTSFGAIQYSIIALIVVASYFAANALLGRYLKKVSLVEILKNRE